MTALYMIIKGIITGIEDAAFKPAVKRGVIARKDPIRGMVPLDVFCSSAPESFRIRYRLPERLFIFPAHAPLLPDVCSLKKREDRTYAFPKCTSECCMWCKNLPGRIDCGASKDFFGKE